MFLSLSLSFLIDTRFDLLIGVPSGWVGFGHTHQGKFKMPAVREGKIPTDENPVVKYCTSYQAAWTHKRKGRWFSCWYPIPPRGYQTIGCVFNFGGPSPSPPNYRTLCVRSDLVKSTRPWTTVWTDKGSGAREDLEVGLVHGAHFMHVFKWSKRSFKCPLYAILNLSSLE